MLCQSAFENFRSFRDKMLFSMQATKMKEFFEFFISVGGKQYFLLMGCFSG